MAMFYVLYFGLGILVSLFFALLEIQIEGKNGWARKLPTWRKKFSFTKFIPGADKEITGYHLYMGLYRFSILHVVFIFIEWSVGIELLLISFHLFVSRVEDFLWFVLNPAYGIKKFKKEFIPWHPTWFLGLPVQYYTSIIVWGLLFWSGLQLL